jgi:lauroyl/myristoyl acyltransferase
VQYRAWQLVSAVIGRVPVRVGYFFAMLAGNAAFYLWPRARRATMRNYERVLPEASGDEIRKIARRSLVNYCAYLTDFVRFPRLSPQAMVANVFGDESFAALDRALERGRGAVVVLMHFGNWDLGAGATAARGYPVTVVAETFRDQRLDEMIVKARSRLGIQVVKIEKTGPSLVRALRKNSLLALLIDRPTPGDGVKVKFFGEEVEVPAGPARLALRTGASVVTAAFARPREGRMPVTTLTDFDIAFESTGNDEEDIRSLTQAIMSSHEQFVRAYPEQWYMFREMWPGKNGKVAPAQ